MSWQKFDKILAKFWQAPQLEFPLSFAPIEVLHGTTSPTPLSLCLGLNLTEVIASLA